MKAKDNFRTKYKLYKCQYLRKKAVCCELKVTSLINYKIPKGQISSNYPVGNSQLAMLTENSLRGEFV